MKTLAFWIDFDNCLSRLIKISVNEREFEIDLQSPLFKHMLATIKFYEPQIVRVGSFSNRQGFDPENMNSVEHNTIASIQALEALVLKLEDCLRLNGLRIKVELDTFLLADVNAGVPHGTTWHESMQYIKQNKYPVMPTVNVVEKLMKPLNTMVTCSDSKLDLFYCKAHATAHRQGQSHVIVYDDLYEPIINPIEDCYSKFRDLLPNNFSCQLFHFDAEDAEAPIKTTDTFIFGTGPIIQTGDRLNYFLINQKRNAAAQSINAMPGQMKAIDFTAAEIMQAHQQIIPPGSQAASAGRLSSFSRYFSAPSRRPLIRMQGWPLPADEPFLLRIPSTPHLFPLGSQQTITKPLGGRR